MNGKVHRGKKVPPSLCLLGNRTVRRAGFSHRGDNRGKKVPLSLFLLGYNCETSRLLYTEGTTAYFDLLLEDFLTTKVFLSQYILLHGCFAMDQYL